MMNQGLGIFSECIDYVFFGRVCDTCNGSGVYSILASVIRIMTIGVGILAVIGIAWTGITYLKSSGDPAKTNKARSRFIHIVIGIAIYIVMFALAEFFLPGGVISNPILGTDETASCPEVTYTDTTIRRPENPADDDGGGGGTSDGGDFNPSGSTTANFASGTYTYKFSGLNGYVLHIPEGAKSGMPLVVYLHGDFYKDNSKNSASNVKGDKPVKKMFKRSDFISLAPIKSRTSWQAGILKHLIDKVVEEYQIDKNRIYVIGFSRGAIGTWSLVAHYPNLIAAAVPMSGCCTTADVKKFVKTKFRIYLGSGDDVCGSSTVKSQASKINKAGGSATVKTITTSNHGELPSKIGYVKLFEWLLAQSRE